MPAMRVKKQQNKNEFVMEKAVRKTNLYSVPSNKSNSNSSLTYVSNINVRSLGRSPLNYSPYYPEKEHKPIEEEPFSKAEIIQERKRKYLERKSKEEAPPWKEDETGKVVTPEKWNLPANEDSSPAPSPCNQGGEKTVCTLPVKYNRKFAVRQKEDFDSKCLDQRIADINDIVGAGHRIMNYYRFLYDDHTLCQDRDEGLKAWLYSWSGIGMDKNRPVSPDNPAKYCPIDIPTKTKLSLRRATITSANRRLKDRGCITELNWQGYMRPNVGKTCRPPSVTDFLVYAYKAGYSFKLEAAKRRNLKPREGDSVDKVDDRLSYEDHWEFSRSSKPVFTLLLTNPLKLSEDIKTVTSHKGSGKSKQYKNQLEVHRYQSALSKMSRRDSSYTPLSDILDRVHCNLMTTSVLDLIRYEDWLYKHEPLNKFVDYVPCVHFSLELGEWFGSRYEGLKASEFASSRRFCKTNRHVLKEDMIWRRYLLYYQCYTSGYINEFQLIEASKSLWASPLDGPSVCNTPTPEEIALKIRKAKRLNRDTEKAPRELEYLSENYAMLYDISISKAWKAVPGMLTKHPDGFDPYADGRLIFPEEETPRTLASPARVKSG